MKVRPGATAAEMKPAILLQMLLETPEEESGITDDQKIFICKYLKEQY